MSRSKAITVGELRALLEGVDDSLPIWVSADSYNGTEIDTFNASATGGRSLKASNGGIFAGPPFDHFSIFADGIPDYVCKDTGEETEDGSPCKCDECRDDSDDPSEPEDDE